MPLRIDPNTDEPYVDVIISPKPAKSETSTSLRLRITAVRVDQADVDRIIARMRHPLVYPQLTAPFPYPEEMATEFLTKGKAQTDRVYKEEIAPALRERLLSGDFDNAPDGPDGKRPFVLSESPVKSIREILEDGTSIHIGDIAIWRDGFREVVDEADREKLKLENEAKAPGDPTIRWIFGYALDPSHHGRGIMTAVLRTVLDEVWIPYLNVHYAVAGAFKDNIGSRQVLLKNGFKMTGYEKCLVDMSSKGRTELQLAMFEWRADSKTT